MPAIRPYKTKSGKKRYQADVGDERRGIPRIKRSFDTKAKAQEFIDAVSAQGHRVFLGKRERRTFGQALAKFLVEESPQKRSHADDISNAKALRYPVWDTDGRRWLSLEHTPLEDMVPALSAWLTDQRLVTRRRYLGNAYYLQRVLADGSRAWYHQPEPEGDDSPPPRAQVKERELLEKLAEPGGRGPFSTDTLRVRQMLVHRVLRLAWKRWNWLEHDIAGRIEFEPAGEGRELFLTIPALTELIAAAGRATQNDGTPDPKGPHFADAIEGASRIGWRRSNELLLDWARVVFPVYEEIDGERKLMQVGVIWVEGDDTKNKELIAHPIGDELLTLLQRRWERRLAYTDPDSGQRFNLVFHDGTGRPWGDTRKRFNTAKKAAGIRLDFRWHDLRHTWASLLKQAGADDREVQELGGWKDAKMVQRYSKLEVQHLLGSVNKLRITPNGTE